MVITAIPSPAWPESWNLHSPVSSVGSLSSGLERTQQTAFPNSCVCLFWIYMRATWNLKSYRLYLKPRRWPTPRAAWNKRLWLRHMTDYLMPGRKSWGESFLGKLEHSKSPIYLGNLQDHINIQGKSLLKITFEDTSFYYGIVPKNSASLAKCWGRVLTQPICKDFKRFPLYFLPPDIQGNLCQNTLWT